MAVRSSPRVVELESRLTPAPLKVVFDFRFDTAGFFTDHGDRVTVLRAAAADVLNRFQDTLAAIPYPTPGNAWQAKFDRPGGVGQQEVLTNPLIPADTLLVFVGARDLTGNELVRPSSDRIATGSTDWYNQVFGRGQTTAYGPAATDFSPWGGSLTFDLFNNWHFGIDPPGNSNEFDFYTAVQNGMMHLLGFGASDAFARLSASGNFLGQNAVASFGGPVPLTGGKFEWVEDTLSKGARTPMDAEFEDGERVSLTTLDLAAMQDIGWTPAGLSPPPPPPPSPPSPPALPLPPSIPPTVIPPGYRLAGFGAGSGSGPNSAVTVNEALSLTQVGQFKPFESNFTGGTRVATGDLNKDGVDDFVVGPGPGRATEVRVYSGANVTVDPTGSLLKTLPAFESSFQGGVFVSVGDLTGDGVPEIAVSPDEGGGPRVRIYDGAAYTQIADFFGIEDPDFRGGARSAIGDLNGDGTPDLVVAAGFGGGPRVAAFDGKTIRAGQTPVKLFPDFFVFESSLRNGVFVALGALAGNKSADLIAGAGPGGGPRVYALSGSDLVAGKQTQVANFFAGDPNSRGGIRVAVDDVDRDGRADLLTGAGTDSQPVVTTYLGSLTPSDGTPPILQQYRIFDADFTGGVFVG